VFAKVVADRYARAALQSCPDLETIERVNVELALLQKTWFRSRETREFLMNPKMPPKLKAKILQDALGDKLSSVVMKLLVLLVEKHRQNIISDISDRYAELTDRARGVEHAEIVLARPFPDDLMKRILGSVQRFSTREVEITIRIDASILGGVVIRLGDRVVDGSLRSRFQEIRRAMLAARLPRSVPEGGV